jgi:predicted nucleic acid-binding protein
VIVVDTNVIAYLMLPGSATRSAERLFQLDTEWCAPLLWRSEFRNVLAGYLRRHLVDKQTAMRLVERAEGVFRGREFTVASVDVLEAVASSSCSACDCEFVVLARELGLPLVTPDRRILRDFPEVARSLAAASA